MINRAERPNISAIESLGVADVEQDGNYYWMGECSQDIVSIQLVFDAGSRMQDLGLQSAVTNAMLLDGTSLASGPKIAGAVDFYGAYLVPSADRDLATLTLYCVKQDFEKLFPIMLDVISDSQFPENDFKVEMSRRKEQFLTQNEKTNILARKKLINEIFGIDNVYGRTTEMEHFDALTIDDVRSFFQTHVKQKVVSVIGVGQLNDSIKRQVKEAVPTEGALLSKPNYEGNIISSKSIKVHKEGAVQSSICIGRRMINRGHADYPGFLMMNMVLGGYFGSRLMSNIREDKGFTYGIHSSHISQMSDAYWAVSTDVGTENTQATLDEIYLEINRLQEDLVSTDELNRVKNYFCGQILKGADGPFAMMDLISRSMMFDETIAYYSQLLTQIKSITSQELRDTASKYLDKSTLTEIVAGN